MSLSQSNLSSLAENEGLTIRTLEEEEKRLPKGSLVKWYNDPDTNHSIVSSEPFHDIDGNVCIKLIGEKPGEPTQKYACFLLPVQQEP